MTAPAGAGNGNLSPDQPLDAVIIGASQAGLAMAWHLAQQNLRFVVLDAAAELGHTWRSRWDSLRLFSPAQYDALPGMPFPATADSYPTKEQVADYVQAYAARFDFPVRLNARVTELRRVGEEFDIRTADSAFRARQVVVATGPFHTPFVPPTARNLDASVTQLHSADYRNAQALPDGAVLVVGGGNSGLQIAQELATTRRVDVAMADKPPILPQRLLGKDLFWWLTRLGFMQVNTGTRLGQRVQARGELVIGTSRRRLAQAGVILHPGVVEASGHTVRFADGHSLDVGVVIWATGYRSDYSWLQVPDVIHDGRVSHRRGVTDVPGLYFLGLSWQHTRGSALLGFVGSDAAYLADHVASYRAAATPRAADAAPQRSA
jgi:putative flavoprotein involved in K+ transport